MKYYQIKTFSRLTGLSVRSLQYYDSLGLLKPSHKTANGYRNYSEADLLRLQQILALKMRGLSLKAIARQLAAQPLTTSDTLQLLEQVLAQRLERLSHATRLTKLARNIIDSGETLDPSSLSQILKLIQGEELREETRATLVGSGRHLKVKH